MAWLSYWHVTVKEQLKELTELWNKINELAQKKVNNELELHQLNEYQNLKVDFINKLNELNENVSQYNFSDN